MATTNRSPQKRQKPPITLYIVRTISLPREQIYQAWVVPKELRRWFGPEDGYTLDTVEIDPKKGGFFRFGMKPHGEDPYFASGHYIDVRANQWLVFTWEWEGERTWSAEPAKTKAPPTTVSIQLKERDDGRATEIFLAQEGFRDEKDREDHRWGWAGCLTRLGNCL